MDKNKFLLTGNTYKENFPGQNSAILYFQNLRRVNMINEMFSYNNGHYQEALTKFGSILSKVSADVENRGAIPFEEYYSGNGYFNWIPASENSLKYPGSPIVFDGTVDIQLSQINFDSNFK